jgi:hypothetical protein
VFSNLAESSHVADRVFVSATGHLLRSESTNHSTESLASHANETLFIARKVLLSNDTSLKRDSGGSVDVVASAHADSNSGRAALLDSFGDSRA